MLCVAGCHTIPLLPCAYTLGCALRAAWPCTTLGRILFLMCAVVHSMLPRAHH
ncbi:pyridine nucleotide-disulfide oxidoreductase [Acetobacter orientalis]|uniref:Pyridine nucleotide-disulfide oxidoreductase n=1 Tax=Acetobacter orientalis TaxID=146474 RepID=A0A2Z5ZM08_9PROT|nr:pyridine nucleotide-disulfide oxidoreductase [Acetobacter orientalis]